jgi:tetratricopeptide (TPR) repeat protein
MIIVGAATTALCQPQNVPRLTERSLDPASYVELAKEWKAYMEKNGESAHGLVNLGLAHEYSGEMEAALIAGRRAVEIAPDHPEALAYLGKLLSKHEGDADSALEYLLRCREIAPDYEYALITIAVIHDKRGQWTESRETYKTIFDQKVLARPLQDFGYNMLVGLPKGAVLVTNGDNDTFAPLALQAGMELRPDVAVVNRHLLNLEEFVDGLFERYPGIKPQGEIEPEEDLSLADTLLERMIEDPDIKVYFASTVPISNLGFSPELTEEGLNLRSTTTGLDADQSARLFLDTYRLDSATDWTIAWDLTPALARMMSNYVSSMVRIAMDDALSAGTKRELLDKAMEIAQFHDLTRLIYILKKLEET